MDEDYASTNNQLELTMRTQQLTKEIEFTPEFIAGIMRNFREKSKWSQEQLAEIAKVNIRTIQRMEKALPSSLDSRRAVAGAFGFKNIDVFEAPLVVPDEEAINTQQSEFKETHLQFSAKKISSGKEMSILAENSQMDITDKSCDMSPAAELYLAALIDNFRDYRECISEMTESDKINLYKVFQKHIDELSKESVALVYANANVPIKWGDDVKAKPLKHSVVYFVVAGVGREPETIAIPKDYQYSL